MCLCVQTLLVLIRCVCVQTLLVLIRCVCVLSLCADITDYCRCVCVCCPCVQSNVRSPVSGSPDGARTPLPPPLLPHRPPNPSSLVHQPCVRCCVCVCQMLCVCVCVCVCRR